MGRAGELEVFREAVAADVLPFHVVHVHGPGGIGKTSLLDEVARLAEASGVGVARIDGQDVAATPEAMAAAATAALEAVGPGRRVLLVDTYEAVEDADDGFRRSFCAGLDAETLVVLASRTRPGVGWRSDPGWRAEMVEVPLRNLSPKEAAAYLQAEGVEDASREAALAFTQGHPLALALVAAHVRQRPGASFEPADAPDVVGALLERFVREEPNPARRAALEAAALVRVVTEPLLGALLRAVGASGGAHDAFSWLRGLHFAETVRDGIRLHDLTREVIAADLRWRDPDRFETLHGAARQFYSARLLQGSPRSAPYQTLADYVFLYRDNPLVRPLVSQLREGTSEGHHASQGLREGDRADLLAMTERHEGEASAAVLAYWLDRRADAVEVYRDGDGKPTGFLLPLRLREAVAADLEADPGLAAASGAAGPLREEEEGVVFRFWMDAKVHQRVSAVQSRVFASTVRTYLTTSGLAVSFLCTSEPDLWGPLLAFAGLQPAPEAAFAVGGHAVTAFAHDWRSEPPEVWLDAVARRVPQAGRPPAPRPPLVVLSREAFGEAVRAALREYARPHLLRASPLLRSRLVRDAAGLEADEAGQIEALRQLIASAARSLAEAPREARYHRALVAAYLTPAPSQMLAAERVGVPFSTFRRHLGRAMEHVVEEMWRREVAPTG